MRILHLILGVFFAALLMAVSREPTGRVAIVVFFTGLGEVILGTTALMALFKTLGALGEARGLLRQVEALVGTAAVLISASVVMNGLLWLGINLVQRVVP
jgi:hypothetical protein